MNRIKMPPGLVPALLLAAAAAAWFAGVKPRPAADAVPIRDAAPASTVPPQYRAVLTAEHADAWQARQELETRLAMIESTVVLHGGALRRGDARYRRAPGGSRDNRRYSGMVIEQEIVATVPTPTVWTQLQHDLVYLGSATVDGSTGIPRTRTSSRNGAKQ
ncbi:MAG TPA: hypothetical protein VGA00_15620 [Acidiferrobacterales bacterium]